MQCGLFRSESLTARHQARAEPWWYCAHRDSLGDGISLYVLYRRECSFRRLHDGERRTMTLPGSWRRQKLRRRQESKKLAAIVFVVKCSGMATSLSSPNVGYWRDRLAGFRRRPSEVFQQFASWGWWPRHPGRHAFFFFSSSFDSLPYGPVGFWQTRYS